MRAASWIVALGILAIVVSRPSIAEASGAVFNDESAWRTAAGNWGLDTFEGTASGTQLASIPLLGIAFDTLEDAVSLPSVQLRDNTGGAVATGVNVLLNDVDFALPGLGPIAMRPLDAGNRITAVGYWNTGGDDTTILSFYDENNVLLHAAESELGNSFHGMVSNVPAARVVISAGSQGNGYFTLDDLQVTVAPIPEPSTLLLASLGGIGALAIGIRRVRSTSRA